MDGPLGVQYHDIELDLYRCLLFSVDGSYQVHSMIGLISFCQGRNKGMESYLYRFMFPVVDIVQRMLWGMKVRGERVEHGCQPLMTNSILYLPNAATAVHCMNIATLEHKPKSYWVSPFWLLTEVF